jgi:ketosteroid isomerase-like protein
VADLLAVVRSYYEALGSGDAERIAAHFTEDAVHYYTRRDPHVGARAIAENAVLGTDAIQGRWVLENGVADSEQAAIEWTMTWADPRSGEPRLDRGAEFFSFREGRISEVRAYYHGGVPKNPSGDLVGFDHAGRGHTVLP